jgi:Cu2+-exporting ATPase/Cu+-exporting ATPase
MSASADGEFCAYCGLPVSPGWWRQTRSTSAESSSNRATFCCFGCRFASAVVASRGEVGALNWTLTRIGLAIFFTLNVMAFSMALWTQDWSHSDAAAPLARSLFELFRYVCLLFALPVLLLLGGPILADAWQSLREGRFTIALLIVLGVGASYLVSAVSVARGSGPVYFEVGCMVLVLVTLGQWLDAVGKHQATQAIEALEKLVPEKVRLLREGDETWVPRSEVRGGDWIRVLPGERIPCDASVRRGTTTVDEQLLTGESVPLVKGPGDAVWGGTLNLEGELVVAVTQSAAEGAWDRLVALVREARCQKGHY